MGLFSFLNNGIDFSEAEETLSKWYTSMTSDILGTYGEDDKVNLQGVIGAPPIFSEYADSKTELDHYGSEYMRRFIEDGNFVAIEAGRPKLYMDEEEMGGAISGGEDGNESMEIAKRLLNVMQDQKGQLFGFQTAMSDYWSDVRQIAAMTAWLLDIEDQLKTIGFDGPIENYPWGDFRSDFIRSYTDGNGDGGRWNFVPFYNDGIIETGESISHTVGPTSIESNINNNAVTNNPLANTAKEYAMLTGMDVADALDQNQRHSENEGVQEQTLLSSIKNTLTGGMAGLNIKMDLPDIWQDTQYSKEYNLKFKLTTPHGDPLSVWLNILVPLAHILPFVSARAIGVTNTYLGGYILRLFSEGMVNMDMGMVTNVNIDRNQKAVSVDGLPTEINVTVTITDLQPMFALPSGDGLGSLAKSTGIMAYLGTLCGYNTAHFNMERRVGLKWDATKAELTNVFTPSGISYTIRNKTKTGIDRGLQSMAEKFLPI